MEGWTTARNSAAENKSRFSYFPTAIFKITREEENDEFKNLDRKKIKNR